MKEILRQTSLDVDVCACLSSVQQVMDQRLHDYKAYGVFCQELHRQLLRDVEVAGSQAATKSGKFLAKLDHLMEHNRFLLRTLKMIQFQTREQEAQQEAIARSAARLSCGLQQGEHAIVALTTCNERELSALKRDIAAQLNANAVLLGREEITLQQMHAMNERICAVYEAIRILVRRVEPYLEARHRHIAQTATYAQLLGGDTGKLERAVATVRRKAGGLLGEDGCYAKVFGRELEQRLRDLYKLRLFMEDYERVLELYDAC